MSNGTSPAVPQLTHPVDVSSNYSVDVLAELVRFSSDNRMAATACISIISFAEIMLNIRCRTQPD